MINFSCPQCGKMFSVQDKLAGRKGKCKACGAAIVVPQPESAKAKTIVITSDQVSPPSTSAPTHHISEGSGNTSGISSAPTNTGKPNADRAPVGTSSPGAQRRASPNVRKLPVRTRRLLADARQMSHAFKEFPLIRVRLMEGDPPDLYQIEYRIQGLARGAGGTPVGRDQHLAEIQLTREYPRQSPKCKMLTPVFHPNFEPATICVGDHWAAGERLIDLVIRIGEMIAYQAYNIRSPLDGEAAMWADHNSHRLPIDNRALRPPEMD